VFPGMAYAPGESKVLGPGDMLLLYTDGATEAAAPGQHDAKEEESMFGEERLLAVLREAAPRGPEAVLDALRDAVLAFSQSDHLRDDLTLMAIQRRA
jgi:phosphoserine phosphatase RsbU/P